jgi:cytochrome b6-f complex iron-sulfur subunit
VKEQKRQSRREFCARTLQGAALAGLGIVLAACGGGGGVSGPSNLSSLPVVNASASGGTITLNIDATSVLAPVGSAALVRAGANSVLVAHTAQDAFVALGATCTHEACTITGVAGSNFVCPCHGSQFSTSGQALSGPARGALPQYPTQFTNGQLVIG